MFGKTGGDPVDLRLFDLGLQGDAGYRIETASGGNRFDLAAAGDVDGDGFDDVVFSRSRWFEDPDFPLGLEYAETWISYGKADSWNVDSGTLEQTGTRVGWSMEDRLAAAAGDLNGDGFDDVALTNVPSYGTVRVLFGGSHLRGSDYSPSFPSPFVIDAAFEGASSGESAPVALGDVDRDGLSDFGFSSASAASRPNGQNVYRPGDEIGSVFAVMGSRSRGPDAAYTMGSAGLRLLGPRLTGCPSSCSNYDPRHHVSFLGDVDLDGADDVFVYTGFGDRGFIVLSRPRR